MRTANIRLVAKTSRRQTVYALPIRRADRKETREMAVIQQLENDATRTL